MEGFAVFARSRPRRTTFNGPIEVKASCSDFVNLLTRFSLSMASLMTIIFDLPNFVTVGTIIGLQMNDFQLDRRPYWYEKPVPCCLGRVSNLFAFNSGVTRNKLLMEKPHHDGGFLLLLLFF